MIIMLCPDPPFYSHELPNQVPASEKWEESGTGRGLGRSLQTKLPADPLAANLRLNFIARAYSGCIFAIIIPASLI